MRPTWVDDRDRRRGGSWAPFGASSMPVTTGLIVAVVVMLLAYVFLGQSSGPVWAWVPLRLGGRADVAWTLQIWRWVTYPFLARADFWLVISLWLLYSYGGMLERAWGSLNFAALFFTVTAVGAVSLGIGSVVLDARAAVLGIGIPLAALVTAWAAVDPELDCNFWGVIIKAKYIGALWVALLFFESLSTLGFGLAFFALGAPAFAFFYVRRLPRFNLSVGRPPDRWAPDLREDRPRREPRGPRRKEERERVGGLNPLRRRQEQAEIDRLRKLLGEDDDERPITRN